MSVCILLCRFFSVLSRIVALSVISLNIIIEDYSSPDISKMIHPVVFVNLGIFFKWLSPPNFIFCYNRKSQRFFVLRTPKTTTVCVLYILLTYINDFLTIYFNFKAFLTKRLRGDRMAGLHLVYSGLFLVIGALCFISCLNLLALGERLALYANTMITFCVTTLKSE